MKDGQPHFARAIQIQFPGVQDIWHGTYVDFLDFPIGRKLRTGLYEVQCSLFGDTVIVAKFSRFPWEIQYLENETTAYVGRRAECRTMTMPKEAMEAETRE